MNIRMSGLDYGLAPIALREQLSFTKTAVAELNETICRQPGVLGAALLSTCNRTELYLSCEEDCEADPGQLLCAAAGLAYGPSAPAFVTRRGRSASGT